MEKNAAEVKDLNIQIGENIRRFRDNKKITREALASATDISVTHLSQLETGNKGTSHVLLIKLAKALEVEVGDFYPTASDPKEENTPAINEFEMLIADCTPNEVEALLNILAVSKSSLKMAIRKAS